ncbi:hypothetical protein F4775DRAFT_334533 [Biscogniauxia sp. FL1348]|nr:hypothetical protein F4775DRAFT_334533 [Biscogniauxia sp. FL1348]
MCYYFSFQDRTGLFRQIGYGYLIDYTIGKKRKERKGKKPRENRGEAQKEKGVTSIDCTRRTFALLGSSQTASDGLTAHILGSTPRFRSMCYFHFFYLERAAGFHLFLFVIHGILHVRCLSTNSITFSITSAFFLSFFQ